MRKMLITLTFGLGKIEKVFIILSGNSSLSLDSNNVPIPDPVPPPNECTSWKPWKYLVKSATFLYHFINALII